MVSVSASPIFCTRLLHFSPCLSFFLLPCLCLVAGNNSKRLTDHNDKGGCRPALNIDVMRIIGVCKTAAKLKAAIKELGETFRGCGRIKVRTAAALNCVSCASSALAHAAAPSASFPSSLPRNGVYYCT